MTNVAAVVTSALCAAITSLVAVAWLRTASVPDRILNVPLFEVGSLWLNACRTTAARLLGVVLAAPDVSRPGACLALAGIACAVWIAYRLLFVELNRVRLLGDLGYIPEGRMTMKDMVNQVRKNRQVGHCPPVYPNGWFAVIESRDLKAKESKTVSMLGLQLAVFRGANGCVHVIDAYCPHLGANLGVGGQVKGNCIECPFHGWLFRGDDGKCVDIPYCRDQKIPEVAKVKSYTVIERNGFVYLWYHAEGVEPYWEPPEIEEITRGEWKYRGRTEHVINCHIEDIPENGADVVHLPQVHGPIMTSGIDLRYTYNKMWSFAKHHWDGYWTASTEENEKHIGTLALTHSMSLFGIHIPILDMHVKARQIGPGIVYLLFDSRVFGKGAFIQSVTPAEPILQRMVHHVYLNTWAPSIVAKVFLISEAVMVERDIMIWNNKRYENKPVLVKSDSDSLLMRHRRWYSQFYSEHSPRLNFQKESLDW